MRAEIGRRLGVTREAVRQWRRRPGFPEPVGKVGQAIAWDWEDVRRWADQRMEEAGPPERTNIGAIADAVDALLDRSVGAEEYLIRAAAEGVDRSR